MTQRLAETNGNAPTNTPSPRSVFRVWLSLARRQKSRLFFVARHHEAVRATGPSAKSHAVRWAACWSGGPCHSHATSLPGYRWDLGWSTSWVLGAWAPKGTAALHPPPKPFASCLLTAAISNWLGRAGTYRPWVKGAGLATGSVC